MDIKLLYYSVLFITQRFEITYIKIQPPHRREGGVPERALGPAEPEQERRRQDGHAGPPREEDHQRVQRQDTELLQGRGTDQDLPRQQPPAHGQLSVCELFLWRKLMFEFYSRLLRKR